MPYPLLPVSCLEHHTPFFHPFSAKGIACGDFIIPYAKPDLYDI